MLPIEESMYNVYNYVDPRKNFNVKILEYYLKSEYNISL